MSNVDSAEQVTTDGEAAVPPFKKTTLPTDYWTVCGLTHRFTELFQRYPMSRRQVALI